MAFAMNSLLDRVSSIRSDHRRSVFRELCIFGFVQDAEPANLAIVELHPGS
jgi:hypothetical protein